jgi:hypothetical protein
MLLAVAVKSIQTRSANSSHWTILYERVPGHMTTVRFVTKQIVDLQSMPAAWPITAVLCHTN